MIDIGFQIFFFCISFFWKIVFSEVEIPHDCTSSAMFSLLAYECTSRSAVKCLSYDGKNCYCVEVSVLGSVNQPENRM